MARSPNPQLAQQWQERLDRFAESELTVAEFCQLEGYSSASFYQWRRKLADDQTLAVAAFVPVDFSASDLHHQHPESMTVELPGGALVKIPRGARLPDCRNLIQAVVEVTVAKSDQSTTGAAP